MKIRFQLLFVLLISLTARAENVHFYITPYSWVKVSTGSGNPSVQVVSGSKFEEETVYRSNLKSDGKGAHLGSGDIRFIVEKLAKPEVHHKGLRHQFTATHKLEIIGKGGDYSRIAAEIHPQDPSEKPTAPPAKLELYGWRDE